MKRRRIPPPIEATAESYIEQLATRHTVYNVDRVAGLPGLLVKQLLEDMYELGDFPIESLRQDMWMSRPAAEKSLQELASAGLVQPSSQRPSWWALGPKASIMLAANAPRRIDAREVKETFFLLMDEVGKVIDNLPNPYWIASINIRPTLFQEHYERSGHMYVKIAVGKCGAGVEHERGADNEGAFLALKKQLEQRFQMLHEALCVDLFLA